MVRLSFTLQEQFGSTSNPKPIPFIKSKKQVNFFSVETSTLLYQHQNFRLLSLDVPLFKNYQKLKKHTYSNIQALIYFYNIKLLFITFLKVIGKKNCKGRFKCRDNELGSSLLQLGVILLVSHCSASASGIEH